MSWGLLLGGVVFLFVFLVYRGKGRVWAIVGDFRRAVGIVSLGVFLCF